jgi:cytidyltransferase-like protein
MSSWEKKVHVKSSLERKNGQFALFIGRWQPLHKGHKEMFQQALDEGSNVLIGIRESEYIDVKNPFTALEVMNNIMTEYEKEIKEKRVKVMILPDICSVEFGRGVGYDIVERIPPQEIAEISATTIRASLNK